MDHPVTTDQAFSIIHRVSVRSSPVLGIRLSQIAEAMAIEIRKPEL